MNIKIALAGNPNSGKTTMFNALTGSSQHVGNWPGVTVEKKSGFYKDDKTIEIIDLPGIYSLSPYTLEEVVTRDYLLSDTPDAIINIIDSTNIERNLYLTTQLIEMGIPVVVALNMTDILRKSGDTIDKEKLSRMLGCPVVETAAIKGEGCRELIETAKKRSVSGSSVKMFSQPVEEIISKIASIIDSYASKSASSEALHNDDSVLFNPAIPTRWYALKVFEKDEKIISALPYSERVAEETDRIIALLEKDMDDDTESIMTSERYNFTGNITKKCVKRVSSGKLSVSDRIDKVVTNRLLALPIFAFVMFLVYFISVSTVGGWATDWVNDVLFGEIIPPATEGFLESVNSAPWLSSLILDGIIGGVGAVLGFLPQMLVLFFVLGLLEECGYMARIAFIMDRIFRKFGLSGKSFIPMLVGTGCSVPGIMASRTIENQNDRRMTIITTSFIPCSAKLPIIALIAGALFPGSVLIAPSAYFAGIASIIVSGIILKKTRGFAGDPSPFVMELPAYHMPSMKNVMLHVLDRGKSFVKKAGTIIFLASGTIWFLSSFDFTLSMTDTSDSILAFLGGLIAPVFAPIGFGNWESAVATITGLIAKENVVGTFGVLLGFEEVAENGAEIWTAMGSSFTQISAYSFLLFNLLCAPCFAAIGAIRREMASARWTWFAIIYQTGFAYTVSFIFYQFALFFTGGGMTVMTIISLAVFAAVIYMILRKPSAPDTGRKLRSSLAPLGNAEV